MDFLSNTYTSLKNQVIKAERRVLKELGFCVHVKHPHKIIITYLQILECEKNVELAQKAWNYMNDCLRTDVFVRFSPEKIACACIFLAARVQKVPLPYNPPWWELFGSEIEDVEEIAVIILGIYTRTRISRSKLELAVEKAKKLVQDRKDASKDASVLSGSFTPAHISPAGTVTTSGSKPGSPTKISPADSTTQDGKGKPDKPTVNNSRSEGKHSEPKRRIERDRNALGIRPYREKQRSPTPPKRQKVLSESESSTASESDSDSSSGAENDKGAENKSSNDETSSSTSEEETIVKRKRPEVVHGRRPGHTEYLKDWSRPRKPVGSENGHKTQYDYNRRIRSRSPSRRSRSRSPSRSRERHFKKDKKLKLKRRIDHYRPKEKLDKERYYPNHSADRYDKFAKKIKR